MGNFVGPPTMRDEIQAEIREMKSGKEKSVGHGALARTHALSKQEEDPKNAILSTS